MTPPVIVTENGLDEASIAHLRSMKTSELIMMLDEDALVEMFADAGDATPALVMHLVTAIAAEIDRRIPVPA